MCLFVGGVGCSEPYVPQQAPEFSVIDLNGKKLSLSDFKGKVVFLEFWATWCPPCVISMPAVEKLSQDYKGAAFIVVSLSVDVDEAMVKKFVVSRHISNRVAVVGESGIDMKYGVQGIPAFFIIDQKGRVTAAWQGYNSVMPKLWRKEIDRLIK